MLIRSKAAQGINQGITIPEYIEGLTQIPNILQLIGTRVGSTVNFSDIARLSGVKNTTLHRYIALLEHVFLILKIPAWTPNIEGQFVKSPKVFLNDTGLLCHLRGESVDGLIANRTTARAFLENFIVMEIRAFSEAIPFQCPQRRRSTPGPGRQKKTSLWHRNKNQPGL